ncbi:MAG TPA: NAD(P)-dependent oxidoreductase [Methylococcus sp.]|nr:NAD(P)-dependent oxidoreductase [Methylococcus sp.]
MRVGFVGLGAMGSGMVRNLHGAGFLSGVWNRTAAKAEALATELGIPAYDRLDRLAAASDLVVICVSADADVLAVIEGLLPGLAAGAVVVDCSTVSGETARRVAERLRSRGVDFLDAPVTGGVEGARNGTLAMMVGGSPEVLERIRPALAAMASRILHMGGVGAGQAAKAVNQVLCAGINQAVTEALAFAEALELDLEKVIQVLCAGAGGNWFLERRGPTMIRGIYEPGFKLTLHHKDLNLCLEAAKDLGLSLPLATATRDDYAALMEQGHGEEDISALFRRKSRKSLA